MTIRITAEGSEPTFQLWQSLATACFFLSKCFSLVDNPQLLGSTESLQAALSMNWELSKFNWRLSILLSGKVSSKLLVHYASLYAGPLAGAFP